MFELSAFADLDRAAFDAVIDVRSPGEFAEDHIPGAINLPVLDDAQRAEVGTLYKQVSTFKARQVGAAYVFRNISTHIEAHLSQHGRGWRPLVYCWRGGQRSGAFAWSLRQIGWSAETLQGGYKSFRRSVVRALYDDDLPFRVICLGGHTGTGKTEILARLAAKGVQVLDLEALARHRGSLLGDTGVPQPGQKAFETAIVAHLASLDPALPLVVEAESSKIGALNLPPSLWKAMQVAPTIDIEAPLDARAAYLARAYKQVLEETALLKRRLAPLRHFRGHEVVAHWYALIDAGERIALCRSLAEQHYDPAYSKAARTSDRALGLSLTADDLSAPALDRLADEITRALQANSI